MAKLIVLDRDGVINYDSDAYIKTPDEWIPIPESLPAIALLKNAGHKVVIATNQSGIGRKLFDLETLNRIHLKMIEMLADLGIALDAIFFCPHTPDDQCECRKPKPGLLLQVADRFAWDVNTIISVGDSWRDLQAANAAGAKSVLVKTGNGLETQANPKLGSDVLIYSDLMEFALSLAHKLPNKK